MPFVDFQPIKEPCMSPEHNPPSMMVLQPGTHTWKCPKCGAIQKINVSKQLYEQKHYMHQLS